MSEKKIERCKFSFPYMGKEEGKVKVNYFCRKGEEEKEIRDSDCEMCENFKSRYIEYPITVSGIHIDNPEYNDSSRVGSLVKIRPCGKEYESKTYLGVLLGDLPTEPYITYKRDNGELTVRNMTNPAIYVFELKRIVFGYESWWGVIEDEDDFKNITDEDIENTWYVQLFQRITENNAKEE